MDRNEPKRPKDEQVENLPDKKSTDAQRPTPEQEESIKGGRMKQRLDM